MIGVTSNGGLLTLQSKPESQNKAFTALNFLSNIHREIWIKHVSHCLDYENRVLNMMCFNFLQLIGKKHSSSFYLGRMHCAFFLLITSQTFLFLSLHCFPSLPRSIVSAFADIWMAYNITLKRTWDDSLRVTSKKFTFLCYQTDLGGDRKVSRRNCVE